MICRRRIWRTAPPLSFPEISLTVVGGGDAVLDWLSASIAKEQMPHIILMDLKLPKLDGLAVLRKLRMHAATRDIPIVAFLAEYTRGRRADELSGQGEQLCGKPVDLEQFAGFFREQLAYWMQPRQRELAFASGAGRNGAILDRYLSTPDVSVICG
jgi:CheY-like chemotaxis protein